MCGGIDYVVFFKTIKRHFRDGDTLVLILPSFVIHAFMILLIDVLAIWKTSKLGGILKCKSRHRDGLYFDVRSPSNTSRAYHIEKFSTFPTREFDNLTSARSSLNFTISK